ncbi:hypothetical protein [Geothrix sp. 21YS21S-4]|uniref:hypothetical protein n=1 Tax=Geothrix sp. 21YS21S-4 TaxID=3068889 RepID=UPI0035938FB1
MPLILIYVCLSLFVVIRCVLQVYKIRRGTVLWEDARRYILIGSVALLLFFIALWSIWVHR